MTEAWPVHKDRGDGPRDASKVSRRADSKFELHLKSRQDLYTGVAHLDVRRSSAVMLPLLNLSAWTTGSRTEQANVVDSKLHKVRNQIQALCNNCVADLLATGPQVGEPGAERNLYTYLTRQHNINKRRKTETAKLVPISFINLQVKREKDMYVTFKTQLDSGARCTLTSETAICHLKKTMIDITSFKTATGKFQPIKNVA